MNKGMSQPAVYTPLESLLLFQSTLAHGVDSAAFTRISEQLRSNGLIQADDTYDSARLNPEPLQQLFLRLFQEELRGGEATVGDVTNSSSNSNSNSNSNSTPTPTSPNSKKRKLGVPPLPTLKDVYENIEKIPPLVDRLYRRYRDDIVRRIREDEKAFDTVQNIVSVIEKSEETRLSKIANAKAGAPPPALAPREIRSVPVSGSPSPSPISSAATVAANKRPTSTTPVVPPKLPSSAVPPTTHVPQGTPTIARPPSTSVPANGPASVLQPPPGITQPPSGVLQAPVQPPKVPISPRPDVNNQNRPPNTIPQPAAGANQGQLKWETPYQPQPPTPHTQPLRQHPTPVPPKTPVVNPQQGQPLKSQQQQQWQSLQGQKVQNIQPAQTPNVPSPSPSAQPGGKPLMAAPQNAGPMPSQLQPPTARPVPASPSPQPRPQSNSPVPHPPPPHRHIQPQQPAQQPRPIAASPNPPAGATGTVVPPPPPQRWPAGQQQPQQGVQHPSAAASPAPVAPQKPYSSPYAHQQPRPAIPEHMIRHAAAGTPLAPRRTSTIPIPPQTPIQLTPTTITRGVATKWTVQATPSTPGGPATSFTTEPQSPAFEPLSPPPPKPATLPRPSAKIPKKQAARQSDVTEAAPTPTATGGRGRVGRPPRGGGSLRGRRPSTTPSASASRRSQSVASQADELSMDHAEPATEVKNEEVTPRPHEETGDTTADESVSGRGNMVTPASMRPLKRKRPETPAEPPGPPTHVMWTRGFTKVSSSALDQISSHRDANMFATGVRERDAPNYRQIVLQPQDITSIRSAIKQGNKAAVAASASLPEGDPGTASVWLPISEDLVPPKGIINSAQLERELVHMFCNAIMYNPDPLRGPGQSFVKRSQDEEEEAFGYQFDENGVVRNTRSMFLEVEKLLGDLRSAEKERTAQTLSTPRRTSTAATPADDTADDEDELAGDGGEGSGTFKRRRLRG
jgi:hypothetical protein